MQIIHSIILFSKANISFNPSLSIHSFTFNSFISLTNTHFIHFSPLYTPKITSPPASEQTPQSSPCIPPVSPVSPPFSPHFPAFHPTQTADPRALSACRTPPISPPPSSSRSSRACSVASLLLPPLFALPPKFRREFLRGEDTPDWPPQCASRSYEGRRDRVCSRLHRLRTKPQQRFGSCGDRPSCARNYIERKRRTNLHRILEGDAASSEAQR